jgi:hypothetical protein
MRKAIICIAAIVLVAMLLCPPWRDVHNYQDKGYHWITSPPGKRWYEPNYRDYPGRYVQDAGTIDFARLGMQDERHCYLKFVMIETAREIMAMTIIT